MIENMRTEYWLCRGEHSGQYATVFSPVDDLGEPVGFGPEFVAPKEVWCTHIREEGDRYGDFLGISHGLLVSERAADFFRTLRFPPGSAFVPGTIVTENREVKGRCTYICWKENARDVLNLHLSGIDPNKYSGAFDPDIVPVIKRTATSDLDFFCGRFAGYVCSDRFRRIVLDNKLTNFAFSPTRVI